jgi:hypothetical protein
MRTGLRLCAQLAGGDLEVRDGFLGDGYAAVTAESLAAVALAEANHHRDNLHRQGAGRAGR